MRSAWRMAALTSRSLYCPLASFLRRLTVSVLALANTCLALPEVLAWVIMFEILRCLYPTFFSFFRLLL